jgi:hypothetical protein
MAPWSRFHRADIDSLRVGDEIDAKALFQSRTGFIVESRVRGKILSLSGLDRAAPPESRFVTGTVLDKHGIVYGFRLTGQDRIRRRSGRTVEPTPSPVHRRRVK